MVPGKVRDASLLTGGIALCRGFTHSGKMQGGPQGLLWRMLWRPQTERHRSSPGTGNRTGERGGQSELPMVKRLKRFRCASGGMQLRKRGTKTD